jgi:hypothetical protein
VDILTLLVVATAINGLLAGGSIFQSVIKTAGWRMKRMHPEATCGRTTDLRIGSVLYRLLEFAGPLSSMAAAVSFFFLLRGQPPSMSAIATYLAAALSAGSIIVPARAAVNDLSLTVNDLSLTRIGDDEALSKTSAQFDRWQTPRSILQGSAFATTLLALVART